MEHIMVFEYTNWKGERSTRRVATIARPRYGSTEHHQPCWYMTAFDLEKMAYRDFDMSKMENIRHEQG